MITEWEAGGNVFAANGQIWGVNGRGEAVALSGNKRGPAELKYWPSERDVEN